MCSCLLCTCFARTPTHLSTTIIFSVVLPVNRLLSAKSRKFVFLKAQNYIYFQPGVLHKTKDYMDTDYRFITYSPCSY
jgi:hypothetical protein